MDRIHDDLDEVKLEAEQLRYECRAKTELYHSLRKAQAEQLAKMRQDKLEIDKLARELSAKSEEICEIRQMCEELQSNLQRKDLVLQKINSGNEKLRAEYGEKISKLECENRDLISSFDEASSRIQDLEEKTRISSDEISGLKRLLSITKMESSEEVRKHASRELKQRDEYIVELEKENAVLKDELKWKNEQFSHLEQAHCQLRAEFESSKTEWFKEKSLLVDEISKLQADFDAQVRVSENLETQLWSSNQALAHEESKRKAVEIELSESRAKFENVYSDCKSVKSEIEELAVKRDEEITELRMSLRQKEMLCNEMNYKAAQLERENNDLLASLKDLQEAQIKSNVSSSSLKKLRNKLDDLENLHSKCSVSLKQKEDKWNSRVEKLTVDMENCLSELDSKDEIIRELKKELEDCRWLLEVKNEENYVFIMTLRSEFQFACSKVFEEKNMFLNEELRSAFEGSQQALEKENASLFVLMNEKDVEIGKLRDQMRQSQSVMLAKSEDVKRINQEKDDYVQLAEDRNRSISFLENEVDRLKNELDKKVAAEFALLESQNSLEQEIMKLSSSIKERNQKIEELQRESVLLDEALKTAENGKIVEIEVKNQIITELENTVISLRDEVEVRKKSIIQSKEVILELESSLQTKKSQVLELKGQLREFELHERALLENLRKASIDKENLLEQFVSICGRIEIFCREDVEMVNMLGRISRSLEENSEMALDEATFLPSGKSVQVILDERSPLSELNC
ncbi:basic helix-loop-helix (bHLH) DNA-binding superfamily protein [Striga hermonthica]|uniref:Basic helix-loop-helix (BHLH) DNA-binding superfamily protein n=1 Tax=Striga hermonthica TaxID=68872 RepID=A0A9N7MKS7_STRHE|nr:basic helix-loop-helix (bHLH) DNA-binding superfamily protein [Striga hermonthica]